MKAKRTKTVAVELSAADINAALVAAARKGVRVPVDCGEDIELDIESMPDGTSQLNSATVTFTIQTEDAEKKTE